MTDPEKFASEPEIDPSVTEVERERLKEEHKKRKPRMTHKALLAALMIFTYYQEPQFQRFYEMLGLFIEVDGLMSSWRRTYTRESSSVTQIYEDFLSAYRRTRRVGSTTDWSQVGHSWYRWFWLSH